MRKEVVWAGIGVTGVKVIYGTVYRYGTTSRDNPGHGIPNIRVSCCAQLGLFEKSMSKQYYLFMVLWKACALTNGALCFIFLAFRHLRRPAPEDSVCRACFVWWVGVSGDDNGKVVC